jgi:hypothetical protein
MKASPEYTTPIKTLRPEGGFKYYKSLFMTRSKGSEFETAEINN